jgi:micrococcal nuclease
MANRAPLPPWLQQRLLEIQQLTTTQTAFVVSAVGLSFLLGVGVGRLPPIARRFATVADIPASYWKRRTPTTLRGRCVSVSDGDTIRVWHTPTLFHGSRCNESEKLSECTLAIRICTVDTPETAKFGKPGQPFGKEARDFLSGLLQDQMVTCRLLQKDQYGRAVAEVSTRQSWLQLPWRRRTYADQELLRAGLAQVYVGSGAVYGHLGVDYYLKLQQSARQLNIGIWSDAHHESAAAYKARTKAY